MATNSETEVATTFLPIVSRHYRITSSARGLHFYRRFESDPRWYHEGDAPDVSAADWKDALRRHVMGA